MDIQKASAGDPTLSQGSSRREHWSPGGLGGCTALEIQVAELERDLLRLEELANEPDLGVSQRQRLFRLIHDTQLTLTSARRELVDCRADLTVVGVERTQGIQYFLINGQGSGYAANNSVPLIAQRTLILRVYVNSKRAQ
jgi:hypothetical protein